MKFLDKTGVPLSVGDYVRFQNRFNPDVPYIGEIRKMVSADTASRIDMYMEDVVMTFNKRTGNQWLRASRVEKLSDEEALLFKLENF